MTGRSWSSRLGLALLLLSQLVATAHASEFGSTRHEHDGVVCLAILNDEQDELVPATDLAAPVFNTRAASVCAIMRPALTEYPRSIWPPATGPPSH